MGAAGRQAARAAGEFPQLAAAPGVAGHRGAAVPFRRLRRRPGREGERRKPRGRGGGATAGMFPQDRGHRGGEGRDLNLALTRPRCRSLPPAFLAAPARSPVRVVPWPPPRAGSGVPSGGGSLCVCREKRAVPASGNCARRAARTRARGGSLGLSRPCGDGQEGRSNFIPLGHFLRAWARGAAPGEGCCIAPGAGSVRGPPGSPGVPLAGPVHKLAPRAGGRRAGGRRRGAKVTSYSESQGFGGCLSQLLLFSLAGRDRGVSV